MKSNTTLRVLFNTADSISLGDEFIRYFSPEPDNEFEVTINLDDERYEFTSEAIDKAKFDDGSWSIYCEYRKQDIDVRFYQIQDMTKAPDDTDEDKVKVRKTRNVSCNADEEVTYSINKSDWQAALQNNDENTEQALLDLQHDGKVERVDYDCETTEITEEFDVEVEEI